MDLDLGKQKNFRITERFLATFRAEAFNIVNHANFNINNNYSTSSAQTFGIYTAAHDPRILQFSLKLPF